MLSLFPKIVKDSFFIVIEKIIVNLPSFATRFVNYHEELVGNEINLANISNNDKIIHVGCGSIPATSIMLFKKTGAYITCIDIDKQAICKALNYIGRIGLSNKILFKRSNLLDISLNEFDVIIISRGVSNIKTILKYISPRTKSDVKIILRTTSDIKSDFIGDIIKDTSFKKISSIISYGTTNSILLCKE